MTDSGAFLTASALASLFAAAVFPGPAGAAGDNAWYGKLELGLVKPAPEDGSERVPPSGASNPTLNRFGVDFNKGLLFGGAVGYGIGAISDEHEEDSEADAPKQESEGVWIVPGSLDVDALEALTGDEDLRDGHFAATTVAGLVSEVAGRIPMPGEVVPSRRSGRLAHDSRARRARRTPRRRLKQQAAGL